jgi:hypothetical protein
VSARGTSPRGTSPNLEQLTRRLAECPAEFLLEPRRAKAPEGQVVVEAVVNDLLLELGQAGGLSERDAAGFRATGAERGWLRLVLVASWLAADPALRATFQPAPFLRWLTGTLPPLARLVDAERFVNDPDRREELTRSLLDALGVLPAGEQPAQAADRLRALSTVERARVIEETSAQQARARQLREKLAAERARQAAARYSSE